MSLALTEFERGVAYWLTTTWPPDFHNGFYQTMADANPQGRFNEAWWKDFLPVLRAWVATRPKGGANSLRLVRRSDSRPWREHGRFT